MVDSGIEHSFDKYGQATTVELPLHINIKLFLYIMIYAIAHLSYLNLYILILLEHQNLEFQGQYTVLEHMFDTGQLSILYRFKFS